MTTVLEPIGAGIAVALINKFIINNSYLWSFCCSGSRPNKQDEHEDNISSTSTTTVDTIEIHAHF